MFNATNLIERALTERGIKCAKRDLTKLSFVEVGFTGENCTIKTRFISTSDDNDVKVLTDDLAIIPKAKREAGFVLINELNATYKFAKFTISEKGAVTAQYDFPNCTLSSELGNIAFEIAIRFSKIVDDIYPMLMKTIWSN